MKQSFRNLFFVQVLLLVLTGCNYERKPIDSIITNDDYNEKCRKLILNENKIGQEYTFKITQKEVDEFKLTYLGNLNTQKGDTLKVVNEINYFGLYETSKRANSSVFIYNSQNKKIGVYYLGGELDLPTKIENSTLIFDYNNESCNQTTAINFKDSIPSRIFIKCKGDKGDIYIFTKEL